MTAIIAPGTTNHCGNCKHRRLFDQRVFNPSLPAGLPEVRACARGQLVVNIVPDVYAMIPPNTDPKAPAGGMKVVTTKNQVAVTPAPDGYLCDDWKPLLAAVDGSRAN